MGWVAAGVAIYGEYTKQQEGQAAAGRTRRQIEKRNKRIRASAREQYKELDRHEESAFKQAVSDSTESEIAAAQARASVMNFSASSGIAGSSLDEMISDINQTAGQNLATIQGDLETNLENIASKARDIRRSALDAIQDASIQEPDALSQGIELASAGLSGYLSGQRIARSL